MLSKAIKVDDNASRSGVIANMTITQFQCAHLVDGCYVISVSQHKTSSSYGPAKITVTQTLYSRLRVYVEYFRSRVLTAPQASHLFFSWNSEGLANREVYKAVQSVLQKAGLGQTNFG